MSRLPMIQGLEKYIDRNNISFHMPGHKNGRGFCKTEEGKRLFDNFFKYDITEVNGVDNFHNPYGIIKESQQLLSELYGSKKSYFLVNGGTSGNFTMIFSSFNEGDKIIVERNCHRSILNAIILRKLKPIYVKNKVVKEFNAPLAINQEHFFHVIENNKDAAGIILTYPNYYGVCADLKSIAKKASEYGMKVLVDAAHGAHFGICEGLPENPLKLGADMVVMSAHKTLPSLTQTAYLHVGEKVDLKKVDFYVSAFLSTSPSYLMMVSLDYARYYLECFGKEDYTRLLFQANCLRERLNKLKYIHVLEKEDLINLKKYDIYEVDFTRFVINIDNNYSASLLENYLFDRGITVEMNDGSNLVLILTPFNNEDDFNKLYNVFENIELSSIKGKGSIMKDLFIPKACLLPCEVLEKNSKTIKLENALGEICAEGVVPYPPGIPIILPGEIIEKDVIYMIEYYLEHNHTVMGIKKRKISVVE